MVNAFLVLALWILVGAAAAAGEGRAAVLAAYNSEDEDEHNHNPRKDTARHAATATSLSHHSSKRQLQFPITEGLTFRRYIVDVRGATSDTTMCDPPVPTFSMTCGLELVLNRAVPDNENGGTLTTCTQDINNAVTCNGSGSVLVDCVVPDDESAGSMMALSLNVQVGVPVDPFSCTVPPDGSSFIGQGVQVGIVCPDNTTSYGQIMCFPPNSYVTPPDAEPLCLETCSDGLCTNQDLTGLSAELFSFDACLWEEESTASPVAPMESTGTTTAPSAAPFSDSTMTSSSPSEELQNEMSSSSPSTSTNLVPTFSPTGIATLSREPSFSPTSAVAMTEEPTLSPTVPIPENDESTSVASLAPSSSRPTEGPTTAVLSPTETSSANKVVLASSGSCLMILVTLFVLTATIGVNYFKL